MQPISVMNGLPRACTSQEATRKKSMKVLSLDHEAIMEETNKRGRLEYEDKDKDKDKDKGEGEGKDEDGSED